MSYDPSTSADIQALNDGDVLNDACTYTVSDGHGGTSSATATIAVKGSSAPERPIGVNDAGSATEKGGTNNNTGGTNGGGNVLDNDTDIDTAHASLVVSAVRTGTEAAGSGIPGTLGAALVGAHGSLTLNADGTYTYVVNELDSAVDALNVGTSLTDTFTYTVSDGALTDTAQLVITINGANDAPVNGFPSTLSVANGNTAVLSGFNRILVSDDSDNLTVTLTAGHGTISLSGISGLNFTAGDGASDATMTFSGAKADVNAALNCLSYTPAAGYVGADSLQIVSSDGSLSDTDAVSITSVNTALRC